MSHIAICKDSIYGKRAGSLHGLAVLYKDAGNVIKNTLGWRIGVVHGVTMLPRSAMYKPDVAGLKTSIVLRFQRYVFLSAFPL